jgi:hypothetical protein
MNLFHVMKHLLELVFQREFPEALLLVMHDPTHHLQLLTAQAQIRARHRVVLDNSI